MLHSHSPWKFLLSNHNYNMMYARVASSNFFSVSYSSFILPTKSGSFLELMHRNEE